MCTVTPLFRIAGVLQHVVVTRWHQRARGAHLAAHGVRFTEERQVAWQLQQPVIGAHADGALTYRTRERQNVRT